MMYANLIVNNLQRERERERERERGGGTFSDVVLIIFIFHHSLILMKCVIRVHII